MAEAILSADELGRQTTVEVTIVGVRRFAWRLRLTRWLLRLASLVSPVDMCVSRQVGRPWLYYCPFCKTDFNGFYIPGAREYSVHCPHCGQQSLASADSTQAWTVKPGDETSCGYECGYVKPYGFVPEGGCPVHD